MVALSFLSSFTSADKLCMPLRISSCMAGGWGDDRAEVRHTGFYYHQPIYLLVLGFS